MVNKSKSRISRNQNRVVLGAVILFLFFFSLSEGLLASRELATYVELEEFVQSSDEMDIHLKIPVVKGLKNPLFQETINTLFRYRLMNFAYELDTLAQEHHRDVSDHLFQYVAYNDFEIYSLEELLSVVFTLYQYTGGAHGLSVKESFTIDVEKGEILSLSHLFEGEEYREVIQREIEKKIEKNRGDYFSPLMNLEFHEDHFYVSEEGVHIYYQLYSIAPYAQGIPVFLIPWEMF